MGFYIPDGEDLKQHINLTAFTWNCIFDDIQSFNDITAKPNLSGFMNRIIDNFHEEARASVAAILRNREEEYISLLKSRFSGMSSADKAALAARLIDKDKATLMESLNIKAKGEYRKIRLNKTIKQYLSDECTEDLYYASPGLYLKALFEEYAALPYVQRERIYFKPLIQAIQDAIEYKKCLKLTSSDRQYIVIPYGIETDKNTMYHYLVGYSIINPLKEYKLVSFRLSRISDIRIMRSKSTSLTLRQKAYAESNIHDKGVQFLAGDIDEIIIRLTEKGIRKYRAQINLRPVYESIEETNIYHFRCTQAQILYYFFKFGADAVILFPPTLKEAFKRLYHEALDAYQEGV